MVISNARPKQVLGGTLSVERGDLIIPSKLKLLADHGWSISDVVKTSKGFELLLQRPLDSGSGDALDYHSVTPPAHVGGFRCPMYCDCLNAEGDKG